MTASCCCASASRKRRGWSAGRASSSGRTHRGDSAEGDVAERRYRQRRCARAERIPRAHRRGRSDKGGLTGRPTKNRTPTSAPLSLARDASGPGSRRPTRERRRKRLLAAVEPRAHVPEKNVSRLKKTSQLSTVKKWRVLDGGHRDRVERRRDQPAEERRTAAPARRRRTSASRKTSTIEPVSTRARETPAGDVQMRVVVLAERRREQLSAEER